MEQDNNFETPSIPQGDQSVNQLSQENKFPNFPGNKIRIVAVILILIVLAISIVSIVILPQFNQKPKTYTLTTKDLGTSIHIKKNDTVSFDTKTMQNLKLNTQISDPSVVGGSEGYDPKTGEFKGKFVGKAKGEADVIVTGSYECKKGSICLPLQVLVFKNHIIVDK